MTTYPHPHGHRIHLVRSHINPWLVALIAAAGLLALGSWVLVDRYAGGSTPEQSATALIDKYNAAISAHDWNAAAAFFTRDAVYYDGSNQLVGRNNIRLEMQGIPASLDYQVKRIAPVIVAHDKAGHEFVTTFANEEPAIPGPVPQVYQLKDGKILREWEFAFGTAPLADAVLR